jgi:hypothetical protein
MSGRSWSEGQLFSGMSLRPWLRLLIRNRLDISPGRWPSALVNTGLATLNSTLGVAQSAMHGSRIAKTPVPDDPVFILGHWRSGTTLLHELLALDVRNRCPTTYECLAPHHFLLTEGVVRRWLRFLMPRKRPWDNMKLGFDHPQEDETALCALGAHSPFLTVAFPKRPPQDPAYVDLLSLSPAELGCWETTARRFYQSVLYRRPGRLVLKSPQHTFRMQTLARIFPRSKFIHIVRDPYVLYSSTVHFWTTTYRQYALQSPPYPGVEEMVYQTFCRLHDTLDAARGEISEDRFTELRYEDLVANPAEQLARLYERLDLGDFHPARQAVEQYAHRTRKYQTNRYELTSGETAEITRRWRRYIERFGYAVRPVPAGEVVGLEGNPPAA